MVAMLLCMMDTTVGTKTNSVAMTRAMAVACTIVEVVVVAVAFYQMWVGNAIGLGIFSVVGLVGLFWTAAMWGMCGASVEQPVTVTPRELHDAVEMDYANLIRKTEAKKLVVTLRMSEPFVTIEAVNNGFAADWLIEAESMFEAYLKSWVQSYGDGDANELRY